MAEGGGNTQDGHILAETVGAVSGRIKKHCEPCCKDKKTTPASVYCKNCREFQCFECSSHHKRFAYLSDHDIVETHKAENDEHHVNMYGYDKCFVHGSSVEVYCEDHDALICLKCAFSDHKKCENAKHIEECSMELKIKEFKEVLTACCDKANEYIDNVKEIGVTEKEGVKAKAERIKSELCAKIDNNLAKYLGEIDIAAECAKSSVKDNVSDVSIIYEQLEQWTKCLDTASKQGFTDKSFILSQSLKVKAQEHKDFLNKQCLDTSSFKIHTEHMFREGSIEQTYDVTVQVNSSDILQQDGDSKRSTDSKNIVELHRKASVLVKKYSNKEEPFVSGIDFLEDGRLLAVDNENDNCLVLDENLSILGKPFTFFNTKPFDICVYKETQAAVTCIGLIYFLKVDELNTIRLIRKVKISASYYSISRFNCSMFLCSTFDDSKAPVRVLDFKGKETDFNDIVFPKIKYEHFKSQCTFAEHLGIITLTDYDSNKVYLINTHTGKTIVVEDKTIENPSYVCMGPTDSVFVACGRCIVRISLKGLILQTIEAQKQYPSALCISRDGAKIVVANRPLTGRVIQSYELTFSPDK
ncbi:uncharacterized protein LOC128214698 [Mya arenaria]|uniref:uncharacterized protein LOC128214698 n=1 Tax=Mya arenaria TaxID=6604 RepID=UPI0022E06907|nr:uncharacterized protein LOC128214698 [Mya arenaria]